MACLVKPPSREGRGVLTFTTQERDRFIHHDPGLARSIETLKSRFLVGLHHNWHDLSFRYDPLFDFSLAGAEDLREVNDVDFSLIPLDACNFVPDYFQPPGADKFWDILFVAHPVFFKRVPTLFEAVRRLYDRGLHYRVLHICPMPPYSSSERETVLYDVRDRYDAMFSEFEQDLFTLLTLDFRYPFPFDLPTLAHFYRSSRVFVHPANDERRCRVAAYAWAAGLPVVAAASVGSLLPLPLRREPYFFEVGATESYDRQLERAVERARNERLDFAELRRELVSEHTVARLDRELAALAVPNGGYSEAPILGSGLDIRLGRHHGIGLNRNSVPQTVADFVRYLATRGDGEIARDVQVSDPERAIAEIDGYRSSLDEVERGLRAGEPGRLRRLAQPAVVLTRRVAWKLTRR
jgi:glycosyltransferase involved in cell wall biosynthesis